MADPVVDVPVLLFQAFPLRKEALLLPRVGGTDHRNSDITAFQRADRVLFFEDFRFHLLDDSGMVEDLLDHLVGRQAVNQRHGDDLAVIRVFFGRRDGKSQIIFPRAVEDGKRRCVIPRFGREAGTGRENDFHFGTGVKVQVGKNPLLFETVADRNRGRARLKRVGKIGRREERGQHSPFFRRFPVRRGIGINHTPAEHAQADMLKNTERILCAQGRVGQFLLFNGDPRLGKVHRQQNLFVPFAVVRDPDKIVGPPAVGRVFPLNAAAFPRFEHIHQREMLKPEFLLFFGAVADKLGKPLPRDLRKCSGKLLFVSFAGITALFRKRGLFRRREKRANRLGKGRAFPRGKRPGRRGKNDRKKGRRQNQQAPHRLKAAQEEERFSSQRSVPPKGKRSLNLL